MLGFPAMSTFRKSSAGAEVKRGYVRVATAVATKSAPPPPTEVPEREQEQEADTSEAAAMESATENDPLLETAVEAAVPQEGDNFTAMEVDDTPEQVILTTEEALIHSEEGFPIHVETEPVSAPTPPPPKSPSPPLDADQHRARTPTPPATPMAGGDKLPINRWGREKPPLSYAALIALVLDDMPDGRGTLNDLYRHVTENFPFYSKQKSAQWQNSIRHNLSLHPEFIRIKKDSGRGGIWTVKPGIDRAALIKVKGEKPTPPQTPPTPVNGAESRSSLVAEPSPFKVPEVPEVPEVFKAAATAAKNSTRSGSPKRLSLEEFLGFNPSAEASTASADKTMTVLSAMDCDNGSEEGKAAAEENAPTVPMPPKGRPAHQQRKARPAVAVPPPAAAAQAAKSGGRFSGSMDYWEQYDPEEASRTGQAVVTTEEGAPASELCFLCGSAGQVGTRKENNGPFSKLP